jgi:transcriptional regulator with XRE-family HTH domain
MKEPEKKIALSGRQVLAGRTLLGLTQAQLAALAGVARGTVEAFESESRDPSELTVAAIKTALESAGVAFANDGAESVCLKRPLSGRPPGVVLH